MNPPVFTRPAKASIAQLPFYNAIGLADIEVVDSFERAKQVVELLLGEAQVGFDTESKPRFRKGEPEVGPHLLQFATDTHAYLFPAALPKVFELGLTVIASSNVQKVGIGLKDDNRQLVNQHGTELNNRLDVSRELARFMEDENPIGLRPAAAMLLGKQIKKSAQMSNWKRFPLDAKQIEYAGIDAHAALAVWRKVAPMLQ